MTGAGAGLGFLFLYSLFTGESKAKVLGSSSAWTRESFFDMSAFSGKKASKSGNDSHRLALLLTQFYSDKHSKSLTSSVVNVLGRNRQVSLRMPKFKDVRKNTHVPVHYGWSDELEPRSAVAELFSKLVPVMSVMKRKGAFYFPPPPPHEELAPASTECSLHMASVRPFIIRDRPELSDYSCASRILTPVDVAQVAQY